MNISVWPRAVNGAGRKIAVVGSGIAGASAAWALNRHADVTVFEAAKRPGGHTATADIDYDGTPVSVDMGFIVYNTLTYPELTALFGHLGVTSHETSMSFSLSLDGGRLEWSGSDLRSVFAQPRNVLSPSFLWMLREIVRFNRMSLADRDNGLLAGTSIGDYLHRRRFSRSFRDNYLLPMAAAIRSTPRARMLDYPADAFITFFENHRLLHFSRPAWRTVSGGARNYLDRLLSPLGARVRLGCPVGRIVRENGGVTVHAGNGAERFDDIVLACHSDQALALLDDATHSERTILSAIPYRANRAVLHRDPRLMPKRKAAWAAWNYLRSSGRDDEATVSLTYWMNRLQGIDPARPLFVSLNPALEPHPDSVFAETSFEHPQFDARALSAQARLDDIQGLRNTWFAGAWTGNGFHEDGLRSGLDAAEALGAVIPWRDTAPEIMPPVAMAAE